MATLLWALPSGAGAVPEIDEASSACLACHAAETHEEGVVPERFARSVHADFGCGLCHAVGYDEFPHASDASEGPADCTACHTDDVPPYRMAWIAKEVAVSIHAQLVSEDFRCTACHDPHDVLPIGAETLRERIATANLRCLACHGKVDEAAAADPEHSREHLREVHAFMPQLELHARASRCVECHTPGREPTVHLILSAKSAVDDCAECHTQNSQLLEKLYRHQAAEQRKQGFTNAVILNNYYMVGATRNEWLDQSMGALLGWLALALGAHGAGRWLTARRRR